MSKNYYYLARKKDLLATYGTQVMEQLNAQIATRRGDGWWQPDFPGLSRQELVNLCRYAHIFGMDNLVYRSFERIAINRAYVRTQDFPDDPHNLLTITREDVLKDMEKMEKEIESIGKELLDKGKDLSEIQGTYNFNFLWINKSYNRNAVEAVLSERYDYYDVGKSGYDAQNSANDKYYHGLMDGTSGNALQHALWNASMTNKVGADTAKLFSDAHEFGLDMSDIGYLMDLENNKTGIAAAIDKNGSAKKIEDMVNNGELVQYPLHGRLDENGVWLAPELQIMPTDGNASYKLHKGLPKN